MPTYTSDGEVDEFVEELRLINELSDDKEEDDEDDEETTIKASITW